jgi:2-polyprenyl-3-methyl-5-hydroxy-6-metoxy-1,4-benzoquinol methylase
MAQRGGQATLLEANPQAAAAARARGLDVLLGDVESVAVDEQYDCVAFLDVLEHLVDPLAALTKARQFIAPGGSLLLSVPNVGHWSVVWDLLQGEFDYQPVGILCNTHLRFFTRRGLERLLKDARFTVERWEDVPSTPPASFAALLDACPQGFAIDRASLAVESFHVLVRPD